MASNPEVEHWSSPKVWLYTLLNRDPKSNAEIVKFARVTEADRFLDVGCGPGAALDHASRTGAEVAGVDPSAAMVKRAAKRVPRAVVAIGSAERIPFPDEAFSVAINVASFHHWADRDAGLREILRVLEPGGRLHIAEGKLRDGDHGHGLDEADAAILTARLEELGYTGMRVDTIETGRRHEHLVVSAARPV